MGKRNGPNRVRIGMQNATYVVLFRNIKTQQVLKFHLISAHSAELHGGAASTSSIMPGRRGRKKCVA